MVTAKTQANAPLCCNVLLLGAEAGDKICIEVVGVFAVLRAPENHA